MYPSLVNREGLNLLHNNVKPLVAFPTLAKLNWFGIEYWAQPAYSRGPLPNRLSVIQAPEPLPSRETIYKPSANRKCLQRVPSEF